jgi:K(+)-stimulated pyrophosphate-energized sodium pump
VGDCVGRAVEPFESYSVMLVTSLILGKSAFGNDGLVFPLIIQTARVLTAIIGTSRSRPAG